MSHANHNHPPVTCPVCGESKKSSECLHGELVRPAVAALIQQRHPDWDAHQLICLSCLNHFMGDFVERTLEEEKGELTQLERDVIASLKRQELLTENLNLEFASRLTFGQRVADKVAEFGGSWAFIISFAVVLFVWIVINSIALLMKPFDPYPYILLNLILSCLASIQAPVIMMSQNRQEAKDRLRAEHDYRTNLKAELEIRQLNAKMDQLLTHQWQRLLEIQQVQMELMEEVVQLSRQKK